MTGKKTQSKTAKAKKSKAEANTKPAKAAKKARALGELIGDTLTPLCRKQGFASSDIVRFWGEIVGPQFAQCSEPERIRWPRRGEGEGFHPGTLVIHCEGAQSVFLEHEKATLIERVNAYFGYPAIERIQILQRPLQMKRSARPEPLRPLNETEAQDLEHQLKGIENSRMADALRRLGHAVKVKGN